MVFAICMNHASQLAATSVNYLSPLIDIVSKQCYNSDNWQWLHNCIHCIQSMDIMYPAISHWYYTECYKSACFHTKNLDTMDTVGMVIDCQTIDSKKFWPVSHWYHYLFKKVLSSGMFWHPDCIIYQHGCHAMVHDQAMKLGRRRWRLSTQSELRYLLTFRPEWTGTNSWQGRPNWALPASENGWNSLT